MFFYAQQLENALKDEQEAYEDCLADLEATQKKLKTVKLQLNALRAEHEGVWIILLIILFIKSNRSIQIFMKCDLMLF